MVKLSFSFSEGYHVDMLATNLAFLAWFIGLFYTCWAFATHSEAPDSLTHALILAASAFCNFFAVATTRLNDSGFTSGLSPLLPPFFICNWLVLYFGAAPTMLVAGSLSGQIIASQLVLPATAVVCGFLALTAIFFRDAGLWIPHVGYLGGAGSSDP